MRLEYQVLAAVAIDLCLGDPRWLPHPVRGIGWLATRLERLARRPHSPPLPTVLRTVPGEGRGEGERLTRAAITSSPVPARVPPGEGRGEGEVVSGAPSPPAPLPEGEGRIRGAACAPEGEGRMRLAGFLVAMAVYLITGAAAWGAIYAAGLAHPLAGDAVAVLVIYVAIAPRDLARHGMAVYRALAGGELAEARRRVAAIVGRDTESLDAAGVARAAVESVAESTVDGVTAPLLFAVVAGPVGAIVYRAINTLDSMFGHQDARYARFGWAAARIDDAANYLPARLTAPLVCLAAMLLGQRGLGAVRILVRDGRNHASPNSGLPEAAMAGALGVQLGGANWYDGQPLEKPTIGDPRVPLSAGHIQAANLLMLAATMLFAAAGVAVRLGAVHLWHVWRAAA